MKNRAYARIQSETLGTPVRENDIVSGAIFIQFLKAYHRYDRKQKRFIAYILAENKRLKYERDRCLRVLDAMKEDPVRPAEVREEIGTPEPRQSLRDVFRKLYQKLVDRLR